MHDSSIELARGGIVEVQPDQIIVLADAAENVMEIDVARAEQARRRAERIALQQGSSTLDTDFIF